MAGHNRNSGRFKLRLYFQSAPYFVCYSTSNSSHNFHAQKCVSSRKQFPTCEPVIGFNVAFGYMHCNIFGLGQTAASLIEPMHDEQTKQFGRKLALSAGR
jgi:hypothetical protein